MNPETIKALKESATGQELIDYIGVKMSQLNHIKDVVCRPQDLAFEVRARQYAYKILQDIFKELDEFKEVVPRFNSKDYVA